mmetsp:Transcript_2727/g.4241  ORF Transcript_2727/g.4241 Transcript_2727/m.4241 type:complete len:556 (-) Transcript_2727:63-1730(-)
MANVTDPLARAVHGTNPQNLIEYITRQKIYDSHYWKEECFGLSASDVTEKSATQLQTIGGSYGPNNKPTRFICLICKMLQIQPEDGIIDELISNEDFKYVRALGAFYLRLTGRPADIYSKLEPLYNDYRRLRVRLNDGWKILHVDEFVDELLKEERVCGIALPRLPKREALVDGGYLDGERVSALSSILAFDDDDGNEVDDDDEKTTRIREKDAVEQALIRMARDGNDAATKALESRGILHKIKEEKEKKEEDDDNGTKYSMKQKRHEMKQHMGNDEGMSSNKLSDDTDKQRDKRKRERSRSRSRSWGRNESDRRRNRHDDDNNDRHHRRHRGRDDNDHRRRKRRDRHHREDDEYHRRSSRHRHGRDVEDEKYSSRNSSRGYRRNDDDGDEYDENRRHRSYDRDDDKDEKYCRREERRDRYKDDDDDDGKYYDPKDTQDRYSSRHRSSDRDNKVNEKGEKRSLRMNDDADKRGGKKKKREDSDKKYGSLFKKSNNGEKQRNKEEEQKREKKKESSETARDTKEAEDEKGGGGGGDGESVEYWNEERAKLGLKPLR